MKHLLSYILISSIIVVSTTSCSDFLDTAPYDALSPATTWKSETDARSFAVGCYNKWLDGYTILYQDCASDIGYNNFPWENGLYTKWKAQCFQYWCQFLRFHNNSSL